MSNPLAPLRLESTPALIADRIRAGILDGTFAPHAQLGEVDLARQLHVSRGPVREALQRLIQEGLLRSERNRGVFVVEIGDEDARDVYLARAAVEKAAAVVVARRQDAAALDRLQLIVDRLVEAERHDWTEVVAIDMEFHTEIVAASGSPRLARMFRTLSAESQLCITRLEPFYPQRVGVGEEHQVILDALRDGDPAVVERLVQQHMDTSAARLSVPRD
jgi:DNA-binding GntR family transcriptional regulator